MEEQEEEATRDDEQPAAVGVAARAGCSHKNALLASAFSALFTLYGDGNYVSGLL